MWSTFDTTWMIGDDISVLVDNETGAGLFLFKRARRHVATQGSVLEETAEQVHAVVVVVAGLRRLFALVRIAQPS